MSASILATKLYLPRPRPKAVRRPHLIARLNEGLRPNEGFGRKLTLLSAATGFGKTTLVSSWIDDLRAQAIRQQEIGDRVAWLSLDEGDNDLARFLAYLIAALQTIAPSVGDGVLAALQAAQSKPPPAKAILTAVLNDLSALADRIILVLDDYHAVDAQPVDQALTFLLQHLPPQMHLVIATREDPQLPLARLRARGQLTELRAADLRFTSEEAAQFLNQVLGLNLTEDDIAALETRTEGWIAGLPLADDRLPLLIQLYFGAMLDDEQVLALLEDQLAQVEEAMATFATIYHRAIQSLAGVDTRWAYYTMLALDYGVTQGQALHAWLTRAIEQIRSGRLSVPSFESLFSDVEGGT